MSKIAIFEKVKDGFLPPVLKQMGRMSWIKRWTSGGM
jgi:hypothetical protein